MVEKSRQNLPQFKFLVKSSKNPEHFSNTYESIKVINEIDNFNWLVCIAEINKSKYCEFSIKSPGKFLPGDFIENLQYLLCDSSYQYETLETLFAERYLQQTDNALQVDKKSERDKY